MSSGFQFLDIIFIAAVAVFIGLRLFKMLGRRTGHQRRPSHLLSRAHDSRKRRPANVVSLPDRPRAKGGDARSDPARGRSAAKPPSPEKAREEGEGERTATEEDDLEAALAEICAADRGFEEDAFLSGAKVAFELIINAFASGDSSQLKNLLSDQVYGDFTAAIRDRAAEERLMETTLVSIEASNIIEAEMAGRTARITVKFTSEQISCARDADGNVVEGDPEHVARVIDIWTFERNVRSRDPNWWLAETRSQN